MANELTRERWVSDCAARYIEVGALDADSAHYFADACAESQEGLNGPFGTEWESASECADDDMSYWENDGE